MKSLSVRVSFADWYLRAAGVTTGIVLVWFVHEGRSGLGWRPLRHHPSRPRAVA